MVFGRIKSVEGETMSGRIRDLFTGLLVQSTLIAVLLLTFSPAASADTADDLRKLQATRFAALVAKDTGTLDNLLSPSLVYTHSNGAVETKEVFIGNIKSGKMVYRSIEPGARMVTVDGAVGVVTGLGDFAVTVAGKEIEAKLRFTDVYVKGIDGSWREIAWQSLKIDPPQ